MEGQISLYSSGRDLTNYLAHSEKQTCLAVGHLLQQSHTHARCIWGRMSFSLFPFLVKELSTYQGELREDSPCVRIWGGSMQGQLHGYVTVKSHGDLNLEDPNASFNALLLLSGHSC